MNSHFPLYRSVLIYRGLAIFICWLAFGLKGSGQYVYIADAFDGAALSTQVWGAGGTNGAGSQTVSGGKLDVDTLSLAPQTRSAVMTHRHDFDPFDDPLEITLRGIEIEAAPVTGGTDAFACMYMVLGGFPYDYGGLATAPLVAYVGAGGEYPSALGFQIMRLSDGEWLFRILDSRAAVHIGEPSVVQSQVRLSGPPTGLVFGVNGPESAFRLEIEGATFSDVLINDLNVNLLSDSALKGSFSRFVQSGLKVQNETVSRLALGAYNGPEETLARTLVRVDSIEVVAPDRVPNIFSFYPARSGGWRYAAPANQSGLGWIYDTAYPYVWSHEAQAWLYLHEPDASAAAFYAWHYGLNRWIWSSVDWQGFYWDCVDQAVRRLDAGAL